LARSMGPTKQIGKWRPEEYYLLEVPKKKGNVHTGYATQKRIISKSSIR